jgi:cell division septum initiation protein DivIVA
MELSKLIQKLEELINSGTGIPATGKLLIDKPKLTQLITQIRSAIPEDIQEAHDLLQIRENLISQAVLEASTIRSASEADAKARVTQSELTKGAEKLSNEILEEANRKAQDVLDETENQADTRRLGADEYAQTTLLELEKDLSKILNTIRRGIESMEIEK